MKTGNAVLKKRIGKALRAWRLKAGLVLTEIAKKIKVSQGSLSDIENGKTSPSHQTCYMLKKKYPETDWDEILFN